MSVSGELFVGNNVDISGNLQTDIGKIGEITSSAAFAHKDQFTTTGYALRHNVNGDTVLNAGSGRTLYLRIGDSSKMTINSSRQVGIGTTSPAFPLDVEGNMRLGTSNGGYIYWLKGGGYANRISIQGDYYQNDSYRLDFRVRGFPNAPTMRLERIGGNSPTLRVNGQQSFGSDDRLKHNEVNLVNALDTINRLQPKVYDKTAEMLDENYNGPLEEGTYNKEVGFIAQEVYEINELKSKLNELLAEPVKKQFRCI